MVDTIPGRDTEIRLSQHVILISHDITLFTVLSLPLGQTLSHIPQSVLYTTLQRQGYQYNGIGKEKEPARSVLPERPCTSDLQYETGVGAPRNNPTKKKCIIQQIEGNTRLGLVLPFTPHHNTKSAYIQPGSNSYRLIIGIRSHGIFAPCHAICITWCW